MFWKTAHQTYGHLGPEDPDIRRYLEVSDRIQGAGCRGLVGWMQDGAHRWIARRTPAGGRILEIGYGNGRHRAFFRGEPADYFVSEYSTRYVKLASWREVRGLGTCCDARDLPYATGSFVAVISVYNLEHIGDLQAVFREVHRVLVPRGSFLVGLPCEGGLLYNVGRELSTHPALERKYAINFDKALAFEHRWDLPGVLGELRRSGRFRIEASAMLPFRIPSHHLNFVAGFRCQAVARP